MADNSQKAKLEEEKLKDGAAKLVAGVFDMTTKAVTDNTNVANFPNIVSVEAVKQANAQESGIYRSPLLCGSTTFDLVKTPVKEEGYPGFGIDADDGSYDTVVGCFEATAKKNGNNNFLGHREILADGTRGDYKWCNYADALEDVKAFGVGLSTLCSISATAGKSGDAGQPRVGIYSINRPEVTKVILALFRQRLICCPLYDTLGPKSVEFILNQADVSVVFCERTKLKNLLEGKGKNLKFVILFEDLTDADKDAAKTAKVKLFSLSDLKNSAAGKSAAPVSTLPADWAYIMYTSGTTGDPKGVCLSHQNMLASASGLIRGNLTYLAEASDVYISYLPMAHSMEICCQMSMIVSGASIGFYSGDVRKLVSEDLPALKPTIMAGVPRVYSRIYDKVMQGLEEKGTLAGWMYKVAYMNQSWHMAAGLARNPIWDWLLFNKVKEALGGRVRLMATGAEACV
jgi:long-chain acyl-CoA synthetase